MITPDLRASYGAAGPYRLPAQAIPSRKKDKDWIKANLDQLEEIGLRDINFNRERFEDAYRIIEGSYTYSDVANTSLFLTEIDHLRSQADVTENLQHYGFLEPIVNELVGEYIKEPNPSVIYTDDPTSTNEFLRKQTEVFHQKTMAAIQREIDIKLVRMGLDPAKNDFNSEEEKQQYIEQISQFREQNIPEEVKQYMSTGWKPIHIAWAEKTLEGSEVRFSMDEIYRNTFRDFLITGRCFVHWRMGHDFYRPERWSVMETFTSVDSEIKYPELGDYVGRVKSLTPNQVLTNYGTQLNEKQKQEILRSKFYSTSTLRGTNIYNTQSWMEQGGGSLQYLPHRHHVAYENAGFIQEKTGINLGYTGYFPNQGNPLNFATKNNKRDDLIQVTEAYWVSQKRVGYFTYVDPETGEKISEIVTDEILKELINEYDIKQIRTKTPEQHFKNPEPNSIVWEYHPEVRYGVKIKSENTDLTEDIYLYGEPLEYQLRGESSIYDTILPVTGIVENTSLVSRLEIDQIEYSMCMNMSRDYMSKELGIFFLMDMAYIPEFIKDQGGEEALDKLLEITRQLGLLPVDSAQAKGTAFNHFQMVNMDLSRAMLDKFTLAEQIRRRAFNKIGLSPERMNMPTEQKTATGVVVTNDASFAQTGLWFDKFSKFHQRNSEMCINVSQWAQYMGKDVTVNYTDSDLTQQFITMNDPNLPMRKFRIYAQNNARRRAELETLRQTYFSDNTISKNLKSMAEVITSDSISNIIKIGKIGEELAQQQQELAHKQQLETIEAQKQGILQENTQKHEYEKEIVMLKGKISLNEKALVALGFAENKDANSNQTPDVVEQLKLTISELDRQFRQNSKEEELRMKQTDMDRKYMTDQEKLNIEKEKIQVLREQSKNQLLIAKTNKNRYDKK